ncbi:MAG: terminase gpP N-terminus-related DNA-binding protein [Candidatus Polarisedimenticolia bacterium]
MDLAQKKKRKEARRLYLTGACDSNAEIGRRLGLKPHTVAKYRKDEDWDGLRQKMDRRAAEKMAEQLATEPMTLNLRHYNYFEVILAEINSTIKAKHTKFTGRELAELVGVVKEAQRGQRLARGMALDGKAEDQIRAESEAELRNLVDVFVEVVKEGVKDEQVRDRIQRAVLETLHRKPDGGTGNGEDPIDH